MLWNLACELRSTIYITCPRGSNIFKIWLRFFKRKNICKIFSKPFTLIPFKSQFVIAKWFTKPCLFVLNKCSLKWADPKEAHILEFKASDGQYKCQYISTLKTKGSMIVFKKDKADLVLSCINHPCFLWRYCPIPRKFLRFRWGKCTFSIGCRVFNHFALLHKMSLKKFSEDVQKFRGASDSLWYLGKSLHRSSALLSPLATWTTILPSNEPASRQNLSTSWSGMRSTFSSLLHISNYYIGVY